MSPMLDIQQRSREIGRLRIGEQVPIKGKPGKTRPGKLSAFRFTTNSPLIAERVASLFGGESRPWVGGTQDYEVYTDASALDVMVPPGDTVISQWHELWSGGGCVRRCDGFTEQLTQTPCVCPAPGPDRLAAQAAGEACKPTTRLNVILPDLPDIGVWRFETKSFYGAVELGGTAELLGRARDVGVIVPARLRVEQRRVLRNGLTKEFPVVVLEVVATLRELATAGGGQSFAEALPPAPSDVKAIAAPMPPAGPTAAGEGADGPAGSSPEQVAEQIRGCSDLRVLQEIALDVKGRGIHNVAVDNGSGVHEALWDLIIARRDTLEAAP